MLLRILVLCLLAGLAHADVAVVDETGARVSLPSPAQRIVSLAPHVTENLYAAGAGAYIVGAVDYSDYPEAALKLPRVGAYSSPDLEAIVALKPDLVVAWYSGTPPAVVAKLKALGLSVYLAQPDRMADIPAGIEKLGRLAGTDPAAARTATAFRQRLAQLRQRHAARPAVPLFYQVWH